MLLHLLRRIRIRTILLVSFVLMNGGLLWLLGTVSYSITSDVITKSAGEARLTTLQDTAERLSMRLAVIEDLALSLSIDPRVEELLAGREDYERARAILDARRLLAQYTRHPEIAGVHLAVRGWKIAPRLTNGVDIIAEEALLEKEWYAPASLFDEGWLGLHVNDIYPNSPDSQVVTYVRRLYANIGREPLGVVLIDVRLPALHRALSGGEETAPLFLARSGGGYFYQVSGAPANADTLRVANSYTLQQGAGYATVGEGSERWLLLHTAPTRGGWQLVQMVPMASLTGGMARIREGLIWGGAACVLVSLILSWGLAAIFGRPIDQLAAAMRRVGEGQLDSRVPVGYQNEFGVLQRGFNQMAGRLERLVDDLQAENLRKRKAELDALQAQINPHFLYNTLDTINWMAIAEKQDRISQAVTLLGRFFRLGLSKGDPMVPLAQELEHLRTYLRLQQIRLRGSFTVHESFAPDLMGLKVPRIVLQPFVENALIHAFTHRGGAGAIHLAGERTDGTLVLTITDDGVGMDPGALPDPGRAAAGYGIRNVHERIRLLFGAPYGVAIDSQPGAGTTVRISLPAIAEGGEARVVSHAG